MLPCRYCCAPTTFLPTEKSELKVHGSFHYLCFVSTLAMRKEGNDRQWIVSVNAMVRGRRHIPESKQRWEGVIFGESSGGHCTQKQHHTPRGAQGQASMPVLPHYAFLFLLPLHLTLPLHYRKKTSSDSKKNTY